jgi:hypothetical protein
MNSMKKTILIAVAAILASSCLSVRLSSMKDDELAKAGAAAWNSKAPEEARPYWESIRDPATKAKYVSSFDRLAELESSLQDALALKGDQAAKQEESFRDIVAKCASFPPELALPADVKASLPPLAANVAQAKLKSGKPEASRAFLKDAVAFLGDGPELAQAQQELDAYARVGRLEQDADAALSAARANADFNDKIAAFEGSVAGYRRAEDSSAAEIKKIGATKDSALLAQAGKLKQKRGNARIEMERLIRDRGTSFKERIGEEFARVPEGDKVGNMGSEDILKFNEEIRANIERQYRDIIAFSDKYPSVIDKDMIGDIDRQKKSLDDRITAIETEVRHAKDIASRGKAAMPLLIGLFNPVPGTKAEGEKSRPAVLRGRIAGEPDNWWGMVSIEPGKMNDLVVTLKDGKEVQVYAENTLSGTMIKKKKLADLVNKGSRIGNSWPVLNAGARLANGQYYLRISGNGNPSYSGEVVVYSSFIARIR